MKIDENKMNLALARKCWNQRRLREYAVISSQTLRNIKAGKEVLPETAGTIARALGVDITELLET